MDNLSSGNYLIRSLTQKDGYIGRPLLEDRSLNPKKITSIPADADDIPKWKIERHPDGSYTLITRGSPVGVEGGRLYGFLMGEEADRWQLVHRPDVGESVFSIVQSSGSEGWSLSSSEPKAHVECRTLLVAPSDPPKFPKDQLWTIVLAE